MKLAYCLRGSHSEEPKSLLLGIGKGKILLTGRSLVFIAIVKLRPTSDGVTKGLKGDALANTSVHELLIFLPASCKGSWRLQVFVQGIWVGSVLQEQLDHLISLLFLLRV